MTVLSDDDLAMILEGKAQKLEDGEKNRDELRDELIELLTDFDGIEVKRGPLQSQGRVSFGRSNEGVEATVIARMEGED